MPIFLEGMVKDGVEAGQLNPSKRQGLRLVVWVQPHLCFICIPGNGFQVTGSSLLSLEPRPFTFKVIIARYVVIGF